MLHQLTAPRDKEDDDFVGLPTRNLGQKSLFLKFNARQEDAVKLLGAQFVKGNSVKLASNTPALTYFLFGKKTSDT